jgi:tetratricopeptide (TPR) repeat protein
VTRMDVATIVLSTIAIVISLISLVTSLWQKEADTQRSIRNQVSALVMEIIKNLRVEDPLQEADQTHRIMSLSRQALYLLKQKPALITDVEYMTVAQGLATAGDYQLADEYWKKSIGLAASDFMKVASQRGYAMYLFWLGKIEEGRDYLKTALRVMENSTDTNKITNVHTYMMWMETEAKSNFWSESHQKYELAKGILESVGNVQMKQNTRKALDDLHSKLTPAHGLSQGQVLPPDLPGPPIAWPKGSSTTS